MEKQNKRLNWSLILLIIFVSSGIGFTIDVVVGFNNYTYLISYSLTILLFFLLYKYIFISTDKKPISIFTENFNIWKYKIWSYIGFYLVSMGVWAIIKIAIDKIDFIKINCDELYISIVISTILISIKGDKILYWWFRIQRIRKIFDFKEHLINQNNIRLYIYIAYFIVLFINYSRLHSETTDSEITHLWINTFATYVAFDRVRSNWHLLWNKDFSG